VAVSSANWNRKFCCKLLVVISEGMPYEDCDNVDIMIRNDQSSWS
jgi:hypothetical protein